MIVQRLKQFIDAKGLTVASFEKSVGMSNASFGKSLKNNGAIGSDKIESILSVYSDINPEWLFTGNGDMLKGKNTSSSVTQSGDGVNANYHGTFNEPINTVIGSNNIWKDDGDKRAVKRTSSIVDKNPQGTLYESDKKLMKALQEIDLLKQANKALREQIKQIMEEKDRAIADKDRAMTMLENAIKR